MKTLLFNLLILCCFSTFLKAQDDCVKSWTYSSSKNLVVTKTPINGTRFVCLQFSEKHAFLLKYFATASKTGAYAKNFFVNNVPFTGELEGRYADGKLAFQGLFEKGKRYGDFLLVSAKGDSTLHTFPSTESQLEVQTVLEIVVEDEKPILGVDSPIPLPPSFPPSLRIDDTQVKKPVIYLYPTEKQDISLKIDFTGKLTHTYPKYNPQTGWNVAAEPSGTIFDKATNLEYYALFWEGENTHQYDLSTGFVVKGEETAQFLDNTLKILGLNRREANEFIMFWLPQMENNAYNLIHFSQEEYTNLAKLDIQPKPETIIRVMMVFQPQENVVQITPQKLPATPIRTGFTVVEWGGTLQPKLEK